MILKARKSIHGIPTFLGVYEAYKTEVMEYGSRGWNAETTKQYDGIVLNHILPHLKNHDNKHIGLLTRSDYDDAIDRLCKQGKNGLGKPFEPWDENGVPAKADYLIRAVVHTASDHFLCEDIFADRETHRAGGGGGRTGDRHIRIRKSLSVREEQAVHRYLMSNMNQMGSTPGLVLMYALGLRNNEACGANFGFITEFTDYPGHYYLVVPQSTELAANSLKVMGKTANSGRKIPLPDTLVKLLMRLKLNRSILAPQKGYTGSIDDLPIACKKGKPWERCSTNDLSVAAREMFKEIGMQDDLIAIHQGLMEEKQATNDEMEMDEFREIESDPTAYLLRRNFATHLSILGLQDADIRYVIGHKIEDAYVQRRAYNDEQLLFRLKRRLDERPLLNFQCNEQLINLESGNTVILEGSKKIVVTISADHFSRIRISATAREPGDDISFRITQKEEANHITSEYLAYSSSPSEEKGRPVDGLKSYREKYRAEIREKVRRQ